MGGTGNYSKSTYIHNKMYSYSQISSQILLSNEFGNKQENTGFQSTVDFRLQTCRVAFTIFPALAWQLILISFISLCNWEACKQEAKSKLKGRALICVAATPEPCTLWAVCRANKKPVNEATGRGACQSPDAALLETPAQSSHFKEGKTEGPKWKNDGSKVQQPKTELLRQGQIPLSFSFTHLIVYNHVFMTRAMSSALGLSVPMAREVKCY